MTARGLSFQVPTLLSPFQRLTRKLSLIISSHVISGKSLWKEWNVEETVH